MLLMFTTLFVGATFPMMLSGLDRREDPLLGLQRRPLPLPLPLGHRLLLDQARLPRRPHRPVVLIVVGAIVLLVLLGRIFWERLARLRAQLVDGGAILRTPRRSFTDLVLPELGSYAARLGDRRRLPRRLRDPGQLPQRRHRDRLQLDLQQRLRHPGRSRRHPGDELSGALRIDNAARPPPPTRSASSDLSAWNVLFASSSSPGSSAGPAASPGRVLLRGRKGQKQRDEGEPQGPQAAVSELQQITVKKNACAVCAPALLKVATKTWVGRLEKPPLRF